MTARIRDSHADSRELAQAADANRKPVPLRSHGNKHVARRLPARRSRFDLRFDLVGLGSRREQKMRDTLSERHDEHVGIVGAAGGHERVGIAHTRSRYVDRHSQ